MSTPKCALCGQPVTECECKEMFNNLSRELSPAAPEPEIDLIGNDPLSWALGELTSLESKFGREIARVANLFGAIRTKRDRAGGVCVCDRADQPKPERAEVFSKSEVFQICGEWSAYLQQKTNLAHVSILDQSDLFNDWFEERYPGSDRAIKTERPIFPRNVPDEIFKEASNSAYLSPEVVHDQYTSDAYIQGFCVAHARFAPSPSSTPTDLGTEGEEKEYWCEYEQSGKSRCDEQCNNCMDYEEFARIKAPQSTTSGEEKVYRWVKAGERLPDYGDDPLGYFRLNGRKVNGNFYDMPFGKAFRVQHHNGDYDVYEKDFDRLEWLEESPAPSFDESNLRACLAAEKKLVAYWKGKAEGLEAGPYIDKYGITYSSEIVYKALQMEKDLAASLITGELPEKKDAEPPADILEWINGESRRYCPHMGMLTQINFFKFGAVAMWRKMQAERPGSSNPEASYWFEKARTNLEDRNDFKAQLSRANERIASLTKELEDGKYNNIWDAWEAFEKANEEMHPMNAIVDPESNSLLPKNQWVVKRASAERGAKWMRQALDQELKDQKAKQREQSKEIASLTAERDVYQSALQEISDGNSYISSVRADTALNKYPKTKQP